MVLRDHLERLQCLLTLAFVWSVVIGLEETARLKGHGQAALDPSNALAEAG